MITDSYLFRQLECIITSGVKLHVLNVWQSAIIKEHTHNSTEPDDDFNWLKQFRWKVDD